MTITSLPARNEYTATAGQTVFNYTFKIFAATDLNVYVTPAGQEANDSTDLITAYTVDPSSIGNAAGGFITLNSGASNGDLITIVSDVPESRTTDYQDNGDFLPDTVNDDFDRVVQLVKQAIDRVGRTLQSQESLQNAGLLTLPNPSALDFLRWKSDLTGLENVDLAATGAPTVSSLVTYETVGNSVKDQLDFLTASIGDNFIINGNFDIWQRGTSFSAVGYAVDRWYYFFSATGNLTQQASTLNQRAIGANQFVARVDGAGSHSIATYLEFNTAINLIGKTVSLSFGSSSNEPGGLNVVVSIEKNATPEAGPLAGGWTTIASDTFNVVSADVFAFDGIDIPDDGTANGIRVVFTFALTGASVADFFRVKLAKGDVSSDFIPRPIGAELSLCQRYYEFGIVFGDTTLTSAANVQRFYIPWLVQKRTSGPVVNVTAGSAQQPTAISANQNGIRVLNDTANLCFDFTYTADNEL